MTSNSDDNLIQFSMANETGDVSQVDMQSSVIHGDSGEMEAGNSSVGGEKSGDNKVDSGGGGDGNDDNDGNELETGENLETEKGLCRETNEMETDSSKDNGTEESETRELEAKVSEIIDERRSSTCINPETENSVPNNKESGIEMVTIERTSYEKLIAEQKRLTDELKRLKERLIVVEDEYTTEILDLEDRESKVRNELDQAQETIAQLKNCIKEVDQPSNWSERMEQLKSERDVALDDVSKLDDKVHRLTASVTNLQLVIEQIQKENEKKVTSLTKQHLAALESERAIQNDLRQEVEMYEKKSMESAQALEAATRLTENIDKKEEIIRNLKQELCDKEKQISGLEMDKANLRASFEGKVDKQVIKNLILGYFGTPNDKKHEVERLLARVLDFNEQEMIRAGLSFGRPSNKFGLDTFTSSGSSLINSNSVVAPSTAVSILLAPLQSTPSTVNHSSSSSIAVPSTGSPASSSTSSYSTEPSTGTSGSLSKMFVQFLEAESRPKGTPTNILQSSSVTRELARDLTKVALHNNHAKSHLLLETTLPLGPVKASPTPIAATSVSLGSSNTSGSSLIANHISQSNSKSLVNPLIGSTPSTVTSIRSSSLSGNLHSNPIRPITINSSNNISESDSSLPPIGSMSTPHQHHQKSSSLSSISSSSSSSSLILSNPMPSFTNAIKPITFDANNHTLQQQQQPPPQIHSLSMALNPNPVNSQHPQPQPLIAQQPPTSHHLFSLSESTSYLKPSHSSSSSLLTTHLSSSSSSSNSLTSPATTTISPVTSSLLLAPSTPSSSDYNPLLSNSHLKVKK